MDIKACTTDGWMDGYAAAAAALHDCICLLVYHVSALFATINLQYEL